MNDSFLVHPLDAHNRALLAHVHPPDWKAPDPAPIYDLVVIGGGTAGLVAAVGAAGLGARVALVERGLLGGDCLNTGCVPSKALLRSARAVREARMASTVGVAADIRVDFAAVMTRLRARRAAMAAHDSAARLRALGVDVFLGTASFTSHRAALVNGQTLTFRRALIATGGRPAAPPIPGLSDIPYLTSENVFWLTDQPRDLIVLGAGPIGCELAQAFALVGTHVTLIDAEDRVLPREDVDAAAIVTKSLERDGVQVVTGVEVHAAARHERGVTISWNGREVTAAAVLVATGRAANIEDLNLAAAGVQVGPRGIVVDDRLRTTNHRVYGAGDVCSPYQFTHAADALARIVIQNALFFGRRRASALVIPWCTYTFPEVAHVGAAAEGGDGAGREAVTIPLRDVDRSVVDDETDGFVKVWHAKGRIVGATVVAPHAGELIGQVVYMMRAGGSLNDLSSMVFPYPTVSEGFRKAGDSYRRTALTPRVRGVLGSYFSLLRRMSNPSSSR